MPAIPDPVQTPTAASSVAPGLSGDAGRQIVIVIDTLVDGVHFPVDTPAADVGFKALAVNLSDLAAMGADPRRARASVTHPQLDSPGARRWLAAFEQGLETLARRFALATAPTLLTRGSLCVTVEAIGSVPRGQALRRVGARVGDNVLVTGTLGDAGLALRGSATARRDAWLQTRLARPEPRVRAGIALRGLASAAIDVSDGLAADLGHILAASGVGARLAMDRLPLSPAMVRALPAEQAWALALGAGDDYELCFTVSPEHLGEVRRRLDALACGCTVIGTITVGGGLECLRADGSLLPPTAGYRHFP